MTDDKVTLTGQVDRPLIPLFQASERYVLLALQAPDAPRRAGRLPLNLSLIIDRSGSMSGDKLEYVKEAAVHALRLLTEQDRAAVVTYDDEVELLAPSRPVTTGGRNDLIQRLRQVRPGGMTNLSGGWFTGCDQVADYLTGDSLNRALLLTDGLANQGLTDQEQLVHEAKELRRRGISTTTFGVGADFNQFLLQGIADAGGGHFYFIDSPKQIPNYFQGELGELLATVAREMALDIQAPAGVELELLNETPQERRENGLRLFLGDAHASEARILVFKVRLPAFDKVQDVFLALTLRYEETGQRRSVAVEADPVRLTVATPEACDKQPANEPVLNEAVRLEAEKAKMEALKKEYSGDVTGAQQALRRAGVILSGMPAPMAAGFLAELGRMEQDLTQGLTDGERKNRHYSAYLAQRSRKDYKK